jgi:hypothetical protein
VVSLFLNHRGSETVRRKVEVRKFPAPLAGMTGDTISQQA